MDKDLVVSTIPATLVDGKAYSLYISGFYDATAKTVEGVRGRGSVQRRLRLHGGVRAVRQRDLELPADDAVRQEHRDTPVGPDVAIGGAVAYKSAGTFVTMPQGTYELNTRYTGWNRRT